MDIPIIGRGDAPRIHPQQRLDVNEVVGRLIAETKSLGLVHGRLILKTPAERTSSEYLLYFDALHEAGCVVVSHTEHPAQAPDGSPWIQAHLLFRLPRELVQ